MHWYLVLAFVSVLPPDGLVEPVTSKVSRTDIILELSARLFAICLRKRKETSTLSVPLSILDLASISEGSTARDAIKASMKSARLADQLGYRRLWFAEHHNTPNLAASSTALLISQAAEHTEKIRVGSGGVMLPNHAPLMVAEQYGTLANMHGDRIDLGLGRAPGTDMMTAQALSRSSAEPQAFAQSIYDLQG